MKEKNKLSSEYDMINRYIEEAISLVLKKKEIECIRVLESLKLFSRSVLMSHTIFDDD